MSRRLTTRGTWPGPVTLRSGWDLAHARPVDDTSLDATLRLERGSVAFLTACLDWLFGEGAAVVLSTPLPGGSRQPWASAGFVPDRELLLLERDLAFPIPPPSHPVRRAAPRDRDRVAEIDDAAFAAGWRIGRAGISDALAATVDSTLLVADGPAGTVAGFAIVGAARPTGYLQRIAVDPPSQSRGIGRSLVRSALVWAKSHGTYTTILNTQPDNTGAIALYRSEGFEVLRERLHILAAVRPASGRSETG